MAIEIKMQAERKYFYENITASQYLNKFHKKYKPKLKSIVNLEILLKMR